jgi:transposase-like protein
LRVPQDRAGRFSTELFERYHRSERALLAALAEMYVQGVCLSAADLVIAVVQGRRYIGKQGVKTLLAP